MFCVSCRKWGGLGLVLGDLLGLVLEEGFLDGVVSSAGAELKLGYYCTANLTWRLVFVNIARCVVVASSGKRSTFSGERVTLPQSGWIHDSLSEF